MIPTTFIEVMIVNLGLAIFFTQAMDNSNFVWYIGAERCLNLTLFKNIFGAACEALIFLDSTFRN